jgi:hypothetical protein
MNLYYMIHKVISLKKWRLIPDPWHRNIQLNHHQNQEQKQALAEKNNLISGPRKILREKTHEGFFYSVLLIYVIYVQCPNQ